MTKKIYGKKIKRRQTIQINSQPIKYEKIKWGKKNIKIWS
jgi:hypothetical protein